jgi:hypothetical protein
MNSGPDPRSEQKPGPIPIKMNSGPDPGPEKQQSPLPVSKI